MTRLIRPKPEKDLFIGWAADTPKVDRRFLFAAAVGLVAGGGGAAWALADAQSAPGPGVWDQGLILDVDGYVVADPYPLIRTTAFGGVKTVLLSSMTKCGVRDRLERLDGTFARIRGSLMQRGPHSMLAVVDDGDWLTPTQGAAASAELSNPQVRSLGRATLRGEILDTKCWYGAMRPADGKVHKACASLCIRFGLPPAMFAKAADGEGRALVMTTPDGGFVTPTEVFLAHVADPVEVDGEIVLVGDLPTFRVQPTSIRRV